MDAEERRLRSVSKELFEGAEVAPGNLAILRELTNPEKRPPRARFHNEPAAPFELDQVEFLVLSSHRSHWGSSRDLRHDS